MKFPTSFATIMDKCVALETIDDLLVSIMKLILTYTELERTRAGGRDKGGAGGGWGQGLVFNLFASFLIFYIRNHS